MLKASKLKEKYDKLREDAAVSMAYDNRVSFGRGVEMSGLDRDEFEEKLSKKYPSTWKDQANYESFNHNTITTPS